MTRSILGFVKYLRAKATKEEPQWAFIVRKSGESKSNIDLLNRIKVVNRLSKVNRIITHLALLKGRGIKKKTWSCNRTPALDGEVGNGDGGPKEN